MEDNQKKVYDLGRADLGAKLRYEYGGDSVAVGVLTMVSHYDSGQSFMQIDGMQIPVSDPNAAVTIL